MFTEYYSVVGDSILGYKKSLNLFNELYQIKHLQGNTAEIGVYKGGTSKLIHMLTPEKTHFAYDTFCGILGSDPNIDIHVNGEFNCDIESVKANINMDNVIYKLGFFPDTFREYDQYFMFVHSDTDTYIGTKATLECFSNCMVKGGKIIFDDYQWINCPGVEKAVSEFMLINNDFEITVYDNSYYSPYDSTSINQCVLTKK